MRIVRSALTLAAVALVATGSRGVAADAEPGFTPLFNGKDLSGWKKQKGEALEGKQQTADKRFHVADEQIVIDAKAKGNSVIESEKTFGKDVHIKFEFLPGPGCNNDLYLRGMKFDLKKADVKNMKEGEWNQFEIIVTGDQAEFKNNGESLKTMKAKPGATPLGVRAELGPIQIRRIRVKEGS
jgi:hypothetical protein